MLDTVTTNSYRAFAFATRVLFGAAPAPMKSNASNTQQIISNLGMPLGRYSQLVQRYGFLGGSVHQLGELSFPSFSTLGRFTVVAVIANNLTSFEGISGICSFVYRMIFPGARSRAEMVGEAVTNQTAEPAINFGVGIAKGLSKQFFKFLDGFANSAMNQAEQGITSLWGKADDAHTLATLRHNQICMNNPECAQIVSELDRATPASAFVAPSIILLATLALTGYFYSQQAVAKEDEPPSTEASTPSSDNPST